MLVIVSTFFDLPRYLPYKWDPANGHYATNNIYIGFLVLMGLLQVRSFLLCDAFESLRMFSRQVLQLIWFSTILRVAYRVITGRGAEDARSDDEECVCFASLSSRSVY